MSSCSKALLDFPNCNARPSLSLVAAKLLLSAAPLAKLPASDAAAKLRTALFLLLFSAVAWKGVCDGTYLWLAEKGTALAQFVQIKSIGLEQKVKALEGHREEEGGGGGGRKRLREISNSFEKPFYKRKE
jgi:hypothetical protein